MIEIFELRPIRQAAISQVVVLTSMFAASTLALAAPPITSISGRAQRPVFLTASTPPRLEAALPQATSERVNALFDLKSQSALTWDELAKLFSVSPRSLHHWMNGKPLTAENELKLARLRAFIFAINKVDRLQVRATLLSPTFVGRTVFDLLRSGEFERARIELSHLPSTKIVPQHQPNVGDVHPVDLLHQADITITDRPIGAIGRRLNIGKPKSRS
jgi:hypothetical protein